MNKITYLFVCSVFGILSSFSPVVASNPVGESDPQESVDEFSKFYLIAGGSAQLSHGPMSSSSVFGVSLGAGYHFSPSFSCELGCAYENLILESDANAEGGMTGVSACFVYHRNISGNLKYIPQFQVDYLTGSVNKRHLSLAGVAIAPLAFEYREDDSFVGITASFGSFGVYYPVSGFTGNSKPVYVLSLNDVSLGLVLYF